MAWTQQNVDDLKTAIAQVGNSQDVSFSDGSRIRYLPIAEAVQLLSLMQLDVAAAAAAAANPTAQPVRAFRGMVRNGY